MARILIIGAGPTGLTTAIQLARYGVKVDVFDKAAELAPESRALGLQSRTLEVLDMIGVVHETLAKGKILRGFSLHSGAELVGRLPLQVTRSVTPYPFEIVLPQSETVRILYQRLCDLHGEVSFRTEVKSVDTSADGVRVSYTSANGSLEERQYDWVVAADGASSVVRHALHIPFNGAEYPEDFLLADATIDWDLAPDDAHLFLRPQGPVVTFPYPKPNFWRLIDTSGESHAADPHAVLQRFQQVFDELGLRARVHDPQWTSVFRIHRRIVERFRHGRCFLIGDAAHVHSPASGQGLNTGLQDGFNLGWKLAAVVNGRSPESILDSVDPERHPVAEEVLKTSDNLTEGILMRSPAGTKLRDWLVRAVLHVPALRANMVEGVSKLDMAYTHSPLNDVSPRHGHGVNAGDRAPNLAPGSAHQAAEERLLPALRTGKWLLLSFTGTEATHLDAAQYSELLSRLSIYPEIEINFVIGPGISSHLLPQGAAFVTDFDGELHKEYGVDESCTFLVRPDGYIAYRRQPLVLDHLQRYIDQVLLKPAT